MKGLPRRVNFIYSTEQALKIVSSLSKPGKMPCFGYSIPASHCITGSELAEIPGTSCHECYARRGWYPKREEFLEKRFQALQNPEWVDAMTFLINSQAMKYFRWHDAGDLQGAWHLEKILAVVAATPQTKHWLPTIEYEMIQNHWRKMGRVPLSKLYPNLTIRLSSIHLERPLPETFALMMGVQLTSISETDYNCPAYSQYYIEHGKKVAGACGDCRKCWDQKQTTITYKLHAAKPKGRPRKIAL